MVSNSAHILEVGFGLINPCKHEDIARDDETEREDEKDHDNDLESIGAHRHL